MLHFNPLPSPVDVLLNQRRRMDPESSLALTRALPCCYGSSQNGYPGGEVRGFEGQDDRCAKPNKKRFLEWLKIWALRQPLEKLITSLSHLTHTWERRFGVLKYWMHQARNWGTSSAHSGLSTSFQADIHSMLDFRLYRDELFASEVVPIFRNGDILICYELKWKSWPGWFRFFHFCLCFSSFFSFNCPIFADAFRAIVTGNGSFFAHIPIFLQILGIFQTLTPLRSLFHINTRVLFLMLWLGRSLDDCSLTLTSLIVRLRNVEAITQHRESGREQDWETVLDEPYYFEDALVSLSRILSWTSTKLSPRVRQLVISRRSNRSDLTFTMVYLAFWRLRDCALISKIAFDKTVILFIISLPNYLLVIIF
jgi:hypothetical protein